MIPENIQPNDILKAIDEIEREGIKYPLTKSKKYDLVYEGKSYPPKLVISLANKYANGSVYPYGEFNSIQARNRLKKLGFVVQERTKDVIAELITKYKGHIKKYGLKDEIYKWELLNSFKGRPNIEQTDFLNEIKSINFANLIYHLCIPVMNSLAEHHPEEYRICFRELYDEKTPLAERVETFLEKVSLLYDKIKPGEKLTSLHDERTVGTLLAYHDPGTYTFFKDSFYQKYCKLLAIAAQEKGKKYAHYLELINDFIEEYILPDVELQDLVKEQLTGDCFEDTHFKILAQDILYQVLDKQVGMERNYWRVGTKEDEHSSWEFMRLSNKICIGWSKLGNLAEVPILKKETLNKLLEDKGYIKNNNSVRSRKAGEIFQFYKEVQIGDVVLAQEGATILGIGIVTSGYEFNPGDRGSHQRSVEWKSIDIPFKNSQGLQTTVYKIKDASVINEVNHLLEEQLVEVKQTIYKMEHPLNQILFGPPGTGKTYNTVNKAIAIVNPHFNLDQPRKEVKKEFDRLVKEGRIVFTTFHQSMSYEDFIEGIKPVQLEGVEGGISYKVVDGIFKKICKQKNLFHVGEMIEKYEVVSVTAEVLTLKKPNSGTHVSFTFSLLNQLVDYLENEGGGLEAFTGKILTGQVDKNKYPELEPFVVNGYSNIMPNLLRSMVQRRELVDIPTTVLIIDEVNRGNVSQIFGELITLIEEDKRLGKEEALEVLLPYSKELFGVPANLYIIGTMNTADRSVEALDAALRRRFCFIEMPPKPNLIAEKGALKNAGGLLEGISLPQLLEVINRRIEKLLDKDHQIGHSYFMHVSNVAELKSAFKHKIIPLLQEYFFGDYAKIGLVIGKQFFDEIASSSGGTIFADFDDSEAVDLSERRTYKLLDAERMADDEFLVAVHLLIGK